MVVIILIIWSLVVLLLAFFSFMTHTQHLACIITISVWKWPKIEPFKWIPIAKCNQALRRSNDNSCFCHFAVERWQSSALLPEFTLQNSKIIAVGRVCGRRNQGRNHIFLAETIALAMWSCPTGLKAEACWYTDSVVLAAWLLLSHRSRVLLNHQQRVP